MKLENLNSFNTMTKQEMKHLVGGQVIWFLTGIDNDYYDENAYEYYYDKNGLLQRSLRVSYKYKYEKDEKRLDKGSEIKMDR
ncbi:MAG: hypothetical protein LBN95_03075 [Prevotellaceae bacterium]|jgi:hypothetical protein|nr:hypothetical protein [Prevotellaceae bacterium]